MSNTKKDISQHPYIDRLYRYLVNEQDARITHGVCTQAGEFIPGDFFLLLLSYIFTKTSDVLADSKTTLPWLLVRSLEQP